MSIITVQGLKEQWSLMEVVKLLKPVIGGQFEPLGFENTGRQKKQVHLRLAAKHNPAQVMYKVNCRVAFQKAGIRATLQEEGFTIPASSKVQTFKIPQKMARALRITSEHRPEEILTVTQMEILIEMQAKFTGLFNLSRKTPGHQLLEDIAKTVFERLYTIMQSNTQAAASCFELSKCYRKLHPHFGDFQLVLSRLHAGEDARGLARTDLTEETLTSPQAHPYSIDNIPYEKIQAATSKYSLKITKKILEHIRNLKCEVDIETDTEEDLARKRVRQELQNVSQYLPSMIRQVIQKHLSPIKTPFNRMRIYGEPYMPNKQLLFPILQRHRAVKIFRSDRMFNLLKCNIPPDRYSSFMALDGTFIDDAKLVIRSSDIPLYKVSDALLAEMKGLFGVVHTPADYLEHNDEDEALELTN